MSEEQQQQQPDDFAGYPDLDGLKNGYRASGGEAKKQRERAELAERQLAQVLAANPRPDVPQRGNDPYERLRDYGVPPEDLRAAIQQEAANVVQQAFAPIAQSFQARNHMLTQYPDYNKWEADVAQHIHADPELEQSYNKMFQTDPAAAMEYAFLKFDAVARRNHKGGGKQEQREAAAEAQIPSSRGSGGRQQADPYEEQLAEAYKAFRQTGSKEAAERYSKLRFRRVIKDDFLNQ